MSARSDRRELETLRARLEEAEETLRAIRSGDTDALVVEGPDGPRIFTVSGAEQPYRVLIEQMLEGAVMLSAAGIVLYCNRRFAEMLAAPLETVIGAPVEPFIGDADRGAFAALLSAGTGKVEIVLQAADGRCVPVAVSANVVNADGMSAVGVVATDLTQQKESERRQQLLAVATAARVQAEEANRAKDEFLAMLGHELRNPLSTIASGLALLGELGSRDAPTTRARDIVTRQVRHLARLVDDLLDVSRLTTGKMTLTRRAMDLAATVEHCVRTVSVMPEAATRAIRVDATPAWIDGDATRIEQVVCNLLTNAIKFTSDGGTIRVSVRAEGEEAVIGIEDDGIGMLAATLPRMFDVFVQDDPGSERSRGGLGLGLTVVRRVVELHGGHVDATSPGRGGGSVFTVRLPRIEAAPETDPPIANAVTGERRRVLVVEDNDDSREMLCQWLALAGHEVTSAADGPAGVTMALSKNPHIALVDVGLPGLDGYGVARAIRREAAGGAIVLIALTGYGRPEDRLRAKDAGFDQHLVKPIDPLKLADIIATISSRPPAPKRPAAPDR